MTILNGGLRKRLRLCPYCGSALPDYRLGIKLTPLKARIYDYVQNAGHSGLPMQILAEALGLTYASTKSHIAQINAAINGRGYRLYGRGGTVRLVQTPPPRKKRKA